MEFHSILGFLENKSIFITGATGFLAKIMVEKILRVQPNVKKLYLLLRAKDKKAATQRFNNEVIGKDLFRVVKEKWGDNFSSLVSEKVTMVAGDISDEALVIDDQNQFTQEMYNQIDVIVNLAATTNFDERYDVALKINTLGAKHVLNFAKKCARLKVFVHVSTAYVCGEKEGVIFESPYNMGDTLNGKSGLDIDEELRLVKSHLTHLHAQGIPQESITSLMKDLGHQRAATYGWPNTYAFTKAMAEMIICEQRENLPVVIIRPTIVTSTYKEPFPGWVEGIRTIDTLAVSYGKGKLTCFLGDLSATLDVIPADMVVNAIMVAMAAHANEMACHMVYHVSSSMRNPLLNGKLHEYGFHYFTAKPLIDKKNGQPIKVGKVTILHDMPSFHRYMTIRYLIFLKAFEVVNTALCHFFDGLFMNLNRKIKYVMRLAELYRPYLFFKGIFDDINTEKLRMAARVNKTETEIFYFDPKCINWDDYFLNIHIPGLIRYVFK